MLVVDFADDLLKNILQRDDTHERAVFVDDNGEMLLALAESL